MRRAGDLVPAGGRSVAGGDEQATNNTMCPANGCPLVGSISSSTVVPKGSTVFGKAWDGYPKVD